MNNKESVGGNGPHTIRKKLRFLWKEFLPLAISDITFALSEPLVMGTMAYLPNTRLNIAAFSVAKAIAVTFESPIIMLIHAANTLGVQQKSRLALARFTFLCVIGVTCMMALCTFQPVFEWILHTFFSIPNEIKRSTHELLFLFILWPGIIAIRRYHQGLLIRFNGSDILSFASISRLISNFVFLFIGVELGLSGCLVAGGTYMGGIIVESTIVTYSAFHLNKFNWNKFLNFKDLEGVPQFYWPLASTMIAFWGIRGLTIAVITHAHDALLAVPAWTAAYTVVVLFGNIARMVQQLTIKYEDDIGRGALCLFALLMGSASTILLGLLAFSHMGEIFMGYFFGDDLILRNAGVLTIKLSLFMPIYMGLLNFMQGLHIRRARTQVINYGAWLNGFIAIGTSWWLVNSGWGGIEAAALGLALGACVELGTLVLFLHK